MSPKILSLALFALSFVASANAAQPLAVQGIPARLEVNEMNAQALACAKEQLATVDLVLSKMSSLREVLNQKRSPGKRGRIEIRVGEKPRFCMGFAIDEGEQGWIFKSDSVIREVIDIAISADASGCKALSEKELFSILVDHENTASQILATQRDEQQYDLFYRGKRYRDFHAPVYELEKENCDQPAIEE